VRNYLTRDKAVIVSGLEGQQQRLCTQYMRKLFASSSDPIQIIIPRKRIQFVKLVDGEIPKDYDSKCNFDCFYYCWKIGLARDIIRL